MKINNFLPEGVESLKIEKPYINLSKLPEGEHKFRIVQRPIAGWIDWIQKKPCRFKPENKPKAPHDPSKPVRVFWALHVWDYSREGLYIMEITQNGIRTALETYARNEDWGDLTTYDIKIQKEGSGIDTRYDVIPVPPKPMLKEIKEAISKCKVRLEALYEGKDPWTDLEDTYQHEPSDKLTETQCAAIDCLLESFEEDDRLMQENFICKRASISDIYFLSTGKFDGVMEHLRRELNKRKTKGDDNESSVA